MSLVKYRQKRHFTRTPEPKGRQTSTRGNSYVVQKHDASHLHYDFRLELGGVLKSWAVPKGPSLDPSIKRLAIHVEDHPVAYGSFEGTIPKGQYGGGTVMLWDHGSWEPIGDPQKGYQAGKLKFILHGQKLRGKWMLLKTKGSTDRRHQEKSWLLIKEHDEEAVDANESDVLEKEPLSVTTGRDLNEITQGIKAKKVRKNPKRSSSSMRSNATIRQPANEDKDYDLPHQTYHGIRLTSPDKILYPEQALTKLDLAHYYLQVADRLLPHIKDRPLVLVRCPEGRNKECFFQKHPRIGTPKNLRQVPIVEKNKTENYVLVDDAEGLISLAQIGVLEIHAWGSRIDRLECPDRLIFDLDPDPSVSWSSVIESAVAIRDLLLELGIRSFVKTTGGKGLHIVLPIQPEVEWDEAKAFCKQVAEFIVSLDETHFTSNMSKASRHGKIFVDYLRNGRGATAVVPYSPRAKAGAPVSCPLTWDELSRCNSSDAYSITNISKRISRLRTNPWQKIAVLHQRLSLAQTRLNQLRQLTRASLIRNKVS